MPNFTHALGLERPCRGRRIAIELGKRRIAATYLGFPDDVLRLAYNASTTEKEIEYFAESLREILRRNN
jgi:selenocysteine lyase/cysteine desulfurase